MEIGTGFGLSRDPEEPKIGEIIAGAGLGKDFGKGEDDEDEEGFGKTEFVVEIDGDDNEDEGKLAFAAVLAAAFSIFSFQ